MIAFNSILIVINNIFRHFFCIFCKVAINIKAGRYHNLSIPWKSLWKKKNNDIAMYYIFVLTFKKNVNPLKTCAI